LTWYLDPCPKNDVISFSRRRLYALGLRLGLGLGFEFGLGRVTIRDKVRVRVEVRVSGNRFKYIFGQRSIRVSVLDKFDLA